MALALVEPTDGNLHEWRKRVKDHWYHVRLLRNLWPKVMDAYKRELKVLSEALGDDHDLAVLGPVLREAPDAYGGAASVQAVLEVAGSRRGQLLEQARVVGRRIYAERARTLLARFQSRW
jgi:CHAD domain-containing protein